ncbi:MAG: NAD-dependent epimerase/dehydratase family protein, partial [Bryobacteraceae bacterium]|nr:NAD-dependent epimerase/dehydratase family protein [Bryobacteraceae bacterium]
MNRSLAEQYRGVPVVVAGASGFIGRWVARLLSAFKAELFLMVRDEGTARTVFTRYRIRGRIMRVDLSCRAAVEAALRETRPAVVFNLAGYGVDRRERKEQEFARMNVEAVEHLSRATAELPSTAWQGMQLVHAGSVAEYGPIGGDLAEGSPEQPVTLYGKSKLAGTRLLSQFCAESGLKGVTGRLATVYGPGEHAGRLLPSLLAAAQSGDAVSLTAGFQKRDFTYVEDVAEGLLRLGATEAQPGDLVNVVTGRLTSVREFAQVAAEVLGIGPE